MTLDSGELTVWRGQNVAAPGSKPKMEYAKFYGSCYADRTIGIARWYTAQQHGDRPDVMVRVQRVYGLSTADLATLQPYTHQDRGAYRIIQIQQVTDDDGLPMTDITLERSDGIDVGILETGAAQAD